MLGKNPEGKLMARVIRLLAGIAFLAALAAGAAAQGTPPAPANLKKATFAGGCFWCMEHPFDEIPGVVSVTSGYTGGSKAKPAYEEVSSGTTGHAESVEVVYDPAKVTYDKLVDVFWHNVDPLTANAQFCDHGTQYRTAIFYHDDEQKRVAEASKEALTKSGRFDKPIVTQIVQASTFWPAEDYHQHYYKTHPIQYKFYRYNCGRDQRLEQLWGKPGSVISHQ
jgi:peptide-methionine (S)-S-oxide reductase